MLALRHTSQFAVSRVPPDPPAVGGAADVQVYYGVAPPRG